MTCSISSYDVITSVPLKHDENNFSCQSKTNTKVLQMTTLLLSFIATALNYNFGVKERESLKLPTKCNSLVNENRKD